jgi:hypothetical protein
MKDGTIRSTMILKAENYIISTSESFLESAQSEPTSQSTNGSNQSTIGSSQSTNGSYKDVRHPKEKKTSSVWSQLITERRKLNPKLAESLMMIKENNHLMSLIKYIIIVCYLFLLIEVSFTYSLKNKILSIKYSKKMICSTLYTFLNYLDFKRLN